MELVFSFGALLAVSTFLYRRIAAQRKRTDQILFELEALRRSANSQARRIDRLHPKES